MVKLCDRQKWRKHARSSRDLPLGIVYSSRENYDGILGESVRQVNEIYILVLERNK